MQPICGRHIQLYAYLSKKYRPWHYFHNGTENEKSVNTIPGDKTFTNVATNTNAFWQCTLQWRHNRHDSVSNHQPHDCLLTRLFRRRSKKTSKLRVTGLCAGNSPGNGEFPAQMASNAENVSIWLRNHEPWCHKHRVTEYVEVTVI